jgi:hypothetical protein
MTFSSKIVITCLVVIGFDALASMISRVFQFEYTRFALVSILIYVGSGFFGAFRQGFVYGMLLGGIGAFTGATAGWFVSQMIGPFMQPPMPPLNGALIVITVIFVTVLGVAFSSVGAALCKLLGHTRVADA